MTSIERYVYNQQPADWNVREGERIAKDIAVRVVNLVKREIDWVGHGAHPSLARPTLTLRPTRGTQFKTERTL